MPYRIADLELTEPLPSIALGAGEQGLGALLRRRGRPIGFLLVELAPAAELSGASLGELAAAEAGEALVREALADEWSAPAPRASGSLTLCARSAAVAAALRTAGADEVRLLGDAAASGDLPGPGYLALLAADVVPDAGWLVGARRAIALHPDAAWITGPVAPSALRGRIEAESARRSGFGGGWTERRHAGPPPASANVLARLGSPPGGVTVHAPDMLAWRAGGGRVARRHLRIGASAARATRDAPAPRLALVRATASRLRTLRSRAGGLALAELAGLASALPGLRSSAAQDPFAPRDVIALELGQDAAAGGTRGAFAVFAHRGETLGHALLDSTERGDAATVRLRALEAIAPAVGQRLFAAGFEAVPASRYPRPAGPPAPLAALAALETPLARLAAARPVARVDPADVSLVICTHARPAELARCLASVAALDPAPGEVVVVDNDPASSAAAVVEAHSGVRYVAAPRAGLSVARNAGIAAAHGAVVAFVDDDTLVPATWLGRLLAGFTGPDVEAVTGAVLPEELRARAQMVFEATMGSAGRGHRPLVFDERFFAPQLHIGAPVWAIGAGAAMALRRSALERLGGFDERLGAGAAGCSEDSELWYRVLAAGAVCRYEPGVPLLHRHREDMAALRRQAHDYLRGHVASLFVQFAVHGHAGNLRRALATVPAHLLRVALQERLSPPAARTGLTAAQAGGYLAGMRLWRLAVNRPPAARGAAPGPPPRARRPWRAGAPPRRAAPARPGR